MRAPFPTIIYTDTAISSLTGIWLGELKQGANLRRGPGLTYAVDRFKGWPHSGHVTLARGERSRLADFASEVL